MPSWFKIANGFHAPRWPPQAHLLDDMSRLEKKHPLAIRWFHWISFPLLSLMIWSGLMIYWANDIYRIGWGNVTLFHFFPDPFLPALNLAQRLPEGMALHFFFMWLFAFNGIVYVLFLLISGEWRYVVPDRTSFRDALLVTLYDLHLRKSLPPQSKYNGAQRIAYTGVILMGAGSLVTGLAIYKPVQLAWLTTLLGGYEWARWEHFWLMLGFLQFFVVHVVQVIRAGWDNFRSMVAGYSLIPSEEPPNERP
jgi:thiosulfate reductase cytochrome b subunit